MVLFLLVTAVSLRTHANLLMQLFGEALQMLLQDTSYYPSLLPMLSGANERCSTKNPFLKNMSLSLCAYNCVSAKTGSPPFFSERLLTFNMCMSGRHNIDLFNVGNTPVGTG